MENHDMYTKITMILNREFGTNHINRDIYDKVAGFAVPLLLFL